MRKVKDDFERRRAKAYEDAEAHKMEIHLKFPVVESLDNAMSRIGLDVYREALKGPSGIEERIEKLRRENLELQKAKAEILIQGGYPADFTHVKYSCEKCSDSGYIGINVCTCLRDALRREAYMSSGLGRMLSHQDFINFNLTLYSNELTQGKTISCRENMKFILEEAKKYVSHFSSDCSQNLIFYGSTGLGKTHISTAIAKGIIDKGFDVVYDTAQNILHSFETERFSRESSGANETAKYYECDFLIIDDLGTEFKNSFMTAALYNLLNTRICAAKPMLISTNLDDAKLLEKNYDKRITSRLIGDFRAFRFVGEDIRLIKAKNGKLKS
jgi:DNA replication protein